jgi:ferritin-like metal-binding protein YciE
MSIASLKELYLDDLGDLYDAERQMIRTFPRLAEAARAPELKEALDRHGEASRLHLERLELIFTHWGEKVPQRRCAGLAGIVQEADNRLTEVATDDARDAAIIGAAQRIEHYEIASYGCVRAYARRLNRPDEARLLQETLDEEGRADRRLTEIAQGHVLDDARSEADFGEPSHPRRLRYVAARALDDERLAGGALEVRNDADEKLGTLDGLIVDADSGAPRYIVVNARGLFSWRRSLLPISLVRFDEAAGVLRIGLDKDLALRYPAFDRDEFDRMDEDALRRYEGRLLAFFPPERAKERVPPIAEGEPPEWLVKSVWLTVPPGDTDRLSERKSAM